MSTAISLQRSEPLQLEHERQVERDWGQLGVGGWEGRDLEGVEDVEEHPALFLPYASPVVLHSVSCTLSWCFCCCSPVQLQLPHCVTSFQAVTTSLVRSGLVLSAPPALSYRPQGCLMLSGERSYHLLTRPGSAWEKTADGYHALEWVNSLYQIATYVFRNETCVEKQW